MTDIAGERRRLADVGFTHRLRYQWGAARSYTDDRDVTEPATRLFLHITVTNPDSYSSHDAHARAVEAIGIARFPATGISYNELLMPGGLLYEAQPLTRRGAHTVNDFQRSTCATSGCPSRGTSVTAPNWNLNYNARALALARNVDDPVIDADVQAAARWGAAVKLAGYVDRDARWHGHRCVSAKLCPGDRGWARLDDIADLTADYVRNGIPGDDMPLTDADKQFILDAIDNRLDDVARAVWNLLLESQVTGEDVHASTLLRQAHQTVFANADAIAAVSAKVDAIITPAIPSAAEIAPHLKVIAEDEPTQENTP